MKILHIALDVPLYAAFDYLAEDASSADVGRRALVPFGTRQAVGIIVGISDRPTVPGLPLKAVGRIFRDIPALAETDLALYRFCAEYYHHPLGAVILNSLPARLRKNLPVAPPGHDRYSISATGKAVHPGDLPTRAVVKRKLLQALQEKGGLDRAALAALSPGALKAAREFVQLGWAEETTAARQPPAELRTALQETVLLTPEQETAVNAVRQQADKFGVWLLHGITGSGKTEVYLRLIDHVLQHGGQALVLVPEINLTPQLEGQFRERFPGVCQVSLHSGLADGERLQHWMMAQNGSARIVLGTRLAVFAPMPELKLLIIDEEHDSSFKQQDGLRYSARDVAIVRAKQGGIPILLGSATPSLESYHNAQCGRYHLLPLTRRAAENAALPEIRCLDIRREKLVEGLSAPLITAVKQRLKRGEQSLIFLNRRGYAPVLMCGQCGWLSSCTRCASRLVLHLGEKRLRCHHCGHEERLPQACPDCGNADLTPLGEGTQRLEDGLSNLFPGARILRVDRDSTRRKHALNEMLQQIHDEQVDILVGTQMLAKGHDFRNLTLVGVLNVDNALYSADFRASERLLAQLMQVGGRAGRAANTGEVLIQTRFPEHPLFHALRLHDYAAFAQTLLSEREQAGFPPFCHQALLRAEALQPDTALQFLAQAAARAPQGFPVTVYDPVPALMPRRAGKARAQLLVQSDSRSALQAFLTGWMDALVKHKSRAARWSLDVDPLEF